MSFRIGVLKFDGGAWLAPLAAVTSAPFRQICLAMGCEQAVTEMVASEALIRDVGKIARRMVRASNERRLMVQLFGGKPESMAQAAETTIERVQPDIIDINMGCPVKKILGVGAGVALMRDPERAAAIVEAVIQAVGPTLPVTVKMRAGWNDEVNAVKFAQCVVQAGAKAVAIHGRTREQYHRGDTRWDIIAEVKKTVGVPVIGNGGVGTAADARAMLDQTGCDAVMIGRGSLGNPWIFRSVVEGVDYVPSLRERFRVVRQHVDLYVQHAGDQATAREMRKHLGWYLRGLVGSAMVRRHLQNMRHAQDVHNVLDAYEDALLNGRARPSKEDFSANPEEPSRDGNANG